MLANLLRRHITGVVKVRVHYCHGVSNVDVSSDAVHISIAYSIVYIRLLLIIVMFGEILSCQLLHFTSNCQGKTYSGIKDQH